MLVVDASVAVKWVLPEPDSAAAHAVVGSDDLVAPDFLMLECANVLARQVRRRLLTLAQATEGLATIGAAGVRLVGFVPHLTEAHRLALALGASAYDSLYLAVALAEGATLVTADTRFADAVSVAYPGVVRLP